MTRGPVPKRTSERRRTNAPEIPAETVKVVGVVDVPEPDGDWHPIASRWYTALAESAQVKYYEPSDWATAYLIAESISRDLQPQVVGITDRGKPVFETIPMKGASLAAYLRAMSVLIVTEGDRRRLRIEVQRQAVEAAPEPVAVLDDFRAL
jgi:hypothetical protein